MLALLTAVTLDARYGAIKLVIASRRNRLAARPESVVSSLVLARRRANPVRRSPLLLSHRRHPRAATLAASGYGGERQSRRECRLGDIAEAGIGRRDQFGGSFDAEAQYVGRDPVAPGHGPDANVSVAAFLLTSSVRRAVLWRWF